MSKNLIFMGNEWKRGRSKDKIEILYTRKNYRLRITYQLGFGTKKEYFATMYPKETGKLHVPDAYAEGYGKTIEEALSALEKAVNNFRAVTDPSQTGV